MLWVPSVAPTTLVEGSEGSDATGDEVDVVGDDDVVVG